MAISMTGQNSSSPTPQTSLITCQNALIHSILARGPIVIGQGCEFDYSGVQACKVLRRDGYRVILVNSNPATIMTDPEFADATYIEPLTLEIVEKIIAAEKPDAILPTVGGQTALNLAMDLHRAGVLDKYGVQLIGAQVSSDRSGRRSLEVQRGDDGRRVARAAIGHRALDRGSAGHRG